jgi:16S rRNA (cytosine1402-N4)-methyltransferase
MIEHKSVLFKETIEALKLREDSVVVDATLGAGGHSLAILKKINDKGRLIGVDQDANAIKNFKQCLKSEVGNLFLVKGNFSQIKNILGGMNVLTVDGILADLGYSSVQMEDKSYGLSFLRNAELDMRLDKNNKLTAKKIINSYDEKKLKKVLREFGEEKFAGKIAKVILKKRKNGEIRKTKELAEIIKQTIPKKFQKNGQHPATKTFQALRIEVNQELENLEKFVPQAIEILKPGGRLAIISFHSLEDRIVKNIFRENARGCICPADFPQCRCGNKAKIKIITKKPIIPGVEEILRNPKARSAKLRVCEKLKNICQSR